MKLETIQDKSFEDAESVLSTNFADPANRFCYSSKDGWTMESELVSKGITVQDVRDTLEPSTKTVMAFHTTHSWAEVKEFLGKPKGELVKMLLGK